MIKTLIQLLKLLGEIYRKDISAVPKRQKKKMFKEWNGLKRQANRLFQSVRKFHEGISG